MESIYNALYDTEGQSPPPLTPPHRAEARGEGNPEAE